MKTSPNPPLPSRRAFLGAAALGTASFLSDRSDHSQGAQDASPLPSQFSSLKPLGSRVVPISNEEFRARLTRAQQLMSDLSPKFDALFVAPGTSLYYFTGIRWWPSERLLALLLPRTGEPLFVCPAFEEGRLREQLRFPSEVRVWQEDESPTKLAAQALADHGLRAGRVAIDETTFFTFFDHFRSAASSFECASADPITIGCRAVKSSHELELMR